ncbi:uncharacterized protein BP01DRAFT_420292 [Aspergillus saccharolyticus JOP 1030-1]|uniref:VWFA domain-containing protein n=1 Tax=Aspergillus saccharolyticus JOP 1030-1 TaxID=1450539 RepID=A0A319AC92_9EURO|nr:hypothetical protein BP01DRAFT_420292 [Aspergillus saccharolyticus JOP 1030-1]PYH49278.1 hypothetical protein BP01DRAFT_420292 [Aspergillus saccharolyticus JOP 1030-1]
MIPTREDIIKFTTIVPHANEGQALLFLQGAVSLDDALSQFYDNPQKYTNHAAADAPPHIQSQDIAAPPPSYQTSVDNERHLFATAHTNPLIEAAKIRARDEQDIQNRLQQIRWNHQIFNDEIEPEHEAQNILNCACDIHRYQLRKQNRLEVLKKWSGAVMYTGGENEKTGCEKYYDDCSPILVWNSNPYSRITTPYGPVGRRRLQKPEPRYHAQWLVETLRLNASLNANAQRIANQYEPLENIWKIPDELGASGDGDSSDSTHHSDSLGPSRLMTQMRRALHLRSSDERDAVRQAKRRDDYRRLRDQIVAEETGRWPDGETRRIVADYQQRVGLRQRIAELRTRCPIQYLHLLRAGYFEPIPVAWATQNSNPLKFRIEATEGWRGITPAWRGFENTAEERLYWVLNDRAGASEGPEARRWLKPDRISALKLAQARMATAIDPPPVYEALDDTCHLQQTSTAGYSRQVMPAPLQSVDAPESPTDNTMILLDVSGSMDSPPVRPTYDQYLITRYDRTLQPKNKGIIFQSISALLVPSQLTLINRDGYRLVTFASRATDMGYINHRNLDAVWDSIHVGGGTRVMTGWQRVKDLHFQQHAAAATYHPVYGWQAGPQMPILRLLLLLDGEATDMDEFELELLSLSWVHVTVFLIGADGCSHHHRHANELQRISEINPHVAFVDAQGNTPERFVTHELLKRHLGYNVPLAEFEEWERQDPPAYDT